MLDVAAISLSVAYSIAAANEFLDRWLETAAKPRLWEKIYRSYESLLRRYVRPTLGERNLAGICPLRIQAVDQMIERGLAARTIR